MATSGMDRMFISVSNLAEALTFYRDWIGMQIAAEGELEAAEIQGLYGLPEGTRARAALLQNDLRDTKLELIEFQPHSGKLIREATNDWDYGIYCITFLVKDLDKIYRELTVKGFQWVSPPVQYQPNWVPYPVKEATLIGPDNVHIDHFQRMTEEDWGTERDYIRFDHCAQYIANIDDGIRFYRDIIGLDLMGQMDIPLGLIDDIIAVPQGTEEKVAFYNRKEANTLTMETLQIGMPAKSLAPVARPPNMGLFMMSFQVDDVAAMMTTCRQQGVEVISGPVALQAGLQGKVRAVTVSSPNGIMIELFER